MLNLKPKRHTPTLRTTAIHHRQTNVGFRHRRPTEPEPIGRFRFSGLQQPVREPRAPHGQEKSSRRVHEATAIGFAKRISPAIAPSRRSLRRSNVASVRSSLRSRWTSSRPSRSSLSRGLQFRDLRGRFLDHLNSIFHSNLLGASQPHVAQASRLTRLGCLAK
jgi:hypothetical protein